MKPPKARGAAAGSAGPKLPTAGVSSAVRRAFNAALHPRDGNGRFRQTDNPQSRKRSTRKPGEERETVGQKALKSSGVGGNDSIEVLSSRVRKYKGFTTVESFVANHPRGRAYALRILAADHKAGRIGFKGAGPAAAAKPPGDTAAIDPGLADGSFRANTVPVTEGLQGDDYLISLNGSKRYPMGGTLEQFVASHPKGREAGLKQVAADMKAGRLQAERTKGQKEASASRPAAKPLDANYRVGQGVSSGHINAVRSSLDKIPAGLRDELKAFGVKIEVSKRSSQVDPEIATMRSASKNTTLESVAGYYNPQTKQVVVNEETALDTAAGRSYKTVYDSAAYARHEFGHAVDHAKGYISQSAAFREAYRQDRIAFEKSGNSASDPKFSYFLQQGQTGPSEMFAEQFNQHVGQASGTSGDLKAAFPRTAAIVADLLKAYAR